MQRKRNLRRRASYHAMVLPMLSLYILFIIYPFLSTVFYSFTDYSSSHLFDFKWVGLKNYFSVLQTKNQLDAIGHTLKYALIITVVQAITAVALAVFLNKKMRTADLLRGVFFFPAVMSPLVVGYIWSFLFSTSSYGPINNILTSLGLGKINFFGNPKIALYSVIFTQIWQWTGYNMVIVLANLRTIDQSYYEAAEIDGATEWQKFWRIGRNFTYVLSKRFGTFTSMPISLCRYLQTGGSTNESTNQTRRNLLRRSESGRWQRAGRCPTCPYFTERHRRPP